MAAPLKKPKIRLGLSELINQIAQQASASQYPPTGTTTTSTLPTPTAVNPSYGPPSPGAVPVPVNQPVPNYTPPQPAGRDANGDFYYAGDKNFGTGHATATTATGPYTPPQPAGKDANGDFYYPGDPQATSQPQGSAQTAPGAAPSAAPAPASKSPYASVADILNEAPPASNDPKAYFQFNMDQMNKIGQFYGMTPDEISAKAAEVQAQIIAASNTKDETGKVVTRQLGNSEVQQIWDAAKQGIIAQKDFNPEAAMNGTSTTGQQSSPMMTDTYDPASNPLSQYGVYTPEEIIGMQAAIGQYVQSGQDQFAQKTGFKAPDATSQAYMAQAQAIPAIQALEGQAALARKVYEQQQQLQYYQIMAQMPQSQSQGTTDPSLQSYLDQNGLAPQGG